MPADILKEAEGRFDLGDDAGDMRPEVSGVFVSELSSGDRERLAGIAAVDDIHEAAPRFAVEGGNVVPDRCAIQGRVFHPRHERRCCVSFPLNVTHSTISGMGDMQSEIEATGSRAEREAAQSAPATPCDIAFGGR